MNREEYIKEAKDKFETLLREQLERADRMKEVPACAGEDGSLDIALVYGDGIGPYIMKEAEDLLNHVLKDEIGTGKIRLNRIEGLTIENRLEKGESVPGEVLQELKKCPVILKGPTATPKGGSMESANVTLRRELDLYANVRPVSIPDKGIDWTFFRENTEGEYVLGSRGIDLGDLTMDFKVITRPGTERIARAAFDYASRNKKNSVSIVTKANIMKKTDGMFSEICHEVAKDYPDIKAEDWYVDIMAANLVNPVIRSDFQVFVLPNLYGDIITDEAAEIQGGVGTAGSANLGDRYAMFEAIHGTAPRMIEDGLQDYANPTSIFKACEMLLRHIGYVDKADILGYAIDKAMEEGSPVRVTGFSDGATTRELSDYVKKLI